jgi:ABC-type transport system involved in multi-copper enzyme maturation permease subunit
MRATLSVVLAELFRIFRKRRTYVIAGFLWLLFPALLLLVGWILETRVAGTFLDEGESVNLFVQAVASPFALARNTLLLLGNTSPNLLMVVIALLAAVFIGEERTHNTWKAVLTNQPSRLAVLFGKVVATMLVLGMLLLGCYLVGALLGAVGMLFLPTTWSGDWIHLAELYLLQWAFALVAVLFASFVIWLVRSLPVAIVTIFFLPAMIEGAIGFYLTVVGLDRLNRLNILIEALRLRRLAETLPQYFFTSNLYAPSRQPLSELAEVFGPGVVSGGAGPLAAFFTIDLPRAALVLFVYGAILTALFIWSFTRRDIT